MKYQLLLSFLLATLFAFTQVPSSYHMKLTVADSTRNKEYKISRYAINGLLGHDLKYFIKNVELRAGSSIMLNDSACHERFKNYLIIRKVCLSEIEIIADPLLPGYVLLKFIYLPIKPK
jgi:hypothetical protein